MKDEFAGVIDGLEWRVALLQEAPPCWLVPLARACRAGGVSVLTSRNSLAFLRAALAERNPDLIPSNEGGSNMVLVRAPARIVELERVTLTRRPERRRMLLARVELEPGVRVAVVCSHLSVPSTGRAAGEALRGAERAVEFAGHDPLIFGGDLNLRPEDDPRPFEELSSRFGLAPATGPKALDHLLARGLDVVSAPRRLAPGAREVIDRDGLRLRLSDHHPVIATFGVR